MSSIKSSSNHQSNHPVISQSINKIKIINQRIHQVINLLMNRQPYPQPNDPSKSSFSSSVKPQSNQLLHQIINQITRQTTNRLIHDIQIINQTGRANAATRFALKTFGVVAVCVVGHPRSFAGASGRCKRPRAGTAKSREAGVQGNALFFPVGTLE